MECMRGDDKAWRQMERYNKRDVKILEDFYKKLLPWIKTHPNCGLYVDSDRLVCNKCGGHDLQKRGQARTQTQVYQRYQCLGCGSWLRDRHNSTPASMKKNVLAEAH